MTKEFKKLEFKVGEYVLLYNSRFRFFVVKLLSKWEGPYVIKEFYRSGAIKINNPEGCQWATNKALYHRYAY